MEINYTSPSLLGSRWGRQGCLLERWNIGSMPNCSLMNTPDGILRASPPHHPPQYVPACHQAGAEGSREVHLPRLMAEPAKAGLWDGHTHQTTCGVPNLLEGDPGPLPWSIFTKKVTWPTALWAPTEGRGNPRHPVLPEELLVETGGTTMLEEDQWGAATATSWPICQPESQSRSWKRDEPHDEVLWKAREAHQWVLEATHRLELNIERLRQGVESAQYQCPCSHSSSFPQSRSPDRCERSLDRCERSLSWHRLERHVTFHDPEVELISSKRSYWGPWGHFTGAQLERGNGGPLPIWRPEMVHPQDMPKTYLDLGNRMGYPPEPSIKNYKMWMDWQACQLDTPHWWAELTAIPEVEDSRKLAQKICTSSLIPAVRCEALPSQDCTVPPAPKCLTRGRFLPDDPSYQDVWWQPLLLTLVYAWMLQYWVEKVRPPTLSDYHPLAMSLVELKQHVEGHITLSKQDVFWNLGSTTHEV